MDATVSAMSGTAHNAMKRWIQFILLFFAASAPGYAPEPRWYDPLGLRTNIIRDIGLTNSSVTVGYDAIDQITSWTAREDRNGPLRLNEQLGWGYDPAHNLHLRTNGALVQTFGSDAVNQLTNSTRAGLLTVSGATPAPAQSITVNNTGAQTYGDFTFASTNGFGLLDGQNAFTIIAHNTYTTWVTNNLTLNLPTNVVVRWDSNGNLTNDGTRSLAYDAENQLTNITFDSTWKTEFVYDGLGRRRVAKDYGWQGGQWVKTNETRDGYEGSTPGHGRERQ